MANDPDSGFLAPSDIADLAGVSRAAVSNWRKRRSDFPEPVGGTIAKPLFDRVDVEKWLDANRPDKVRPDRDVAGLALWSVMNRFRRDVPMQVMRALALAVLCARKLVDGTSDAHELGRQAAQGRFLQAVDRIASDDSADPRWCHLVRMDLDDSLIEHDGASGETRRNIDRLTADLYGAANAIDVDELASAADYVIDRVTGTEGRTAGEHGAVQSRMSRLLADLASSIDAATTATAYDPACGIGEALIRFWQHSPHPDRLRLYGAEIDGGYALICRQRCFLYGAEATIDCVDVLKRDPLPDLRADVVLAEPPFGLEMPTGFSLTDPRWTLAGPPPKNNSETAWLQHVITHLAPGGRGLVVTGLNATSAPNSIDNRRALVQRGCIDAVVVLPRKLLTYTSIPTALWIVGVPDQPRVGDRLTFVDASDLAPTERFRLHHWLTEPAHDDEKVLSARIPTEAVLADEQLRLDPRRWTRTVGDPDEIVHDYSLATEAIDAAIRTVTHTADHTFGVVAPASRTVTIRALERQDALRIVRGDKTRLNPAHEADPWHPDSPDTHDPRIVTRRMIRETNRQGLLALNSPVHRNSDDASITGESTVDIDDGYTEAGDVLVCTGGFVQAVVDETGGRITESGVFRLVVDPHHFEPHYIAECLNSSWNQPARSGSHPAMLRDLEIPLLPLADQIRLIAEVKGARELAATGRLLTSSAEQLVAAQLDAIRYKVQLVRVDLDDSARQTPRSGRMANLDFDEYTPVPAPVPQPARQIDL